MASKGYSVRNLQFVLYELLDVVSLTEEGYFSNHSRENFDIMLEVAEDIAAAGQEQSPPGLDRIDLTADRLRDGNRRLWLDDVKGQDQSMLEAHRRPQEDDGEKGSFRELPGGPFK